MSPVAYIGFGANLGDVFHTFRRAVDALARIPGIVVMRCSRLYETKPIGLPEDAPDFLNAVIELETTCAPRDLMNILRSIEVTLGKTPDHRSDRSRFADLDLLLYGAEAVDEEGLIIPHPRMHHRAFVLAPLAELNPRMTLPTLNRRVVDLLHDLPATELEEVRPMSDPTGK